MKLLCAAIVAVISILSRSGAQYINSHNFQTLQAPRPPGSVITTSNTSTNTCEYKDPMSGCTTCSNLIALAQSTMTNALLDAQQGCSADFQCSLQSVSTDCSHVCLQPILTSKADDLAVKIMQLNKQYCDNPGFQSTCSSYITTTTSSASTSANVVQCPERVAYCDFSSTSSTTTSPTTTGPTPPLPISATISSNTSSSINTSSKIGVCASRNKLVAAATEIFATPNSVAGIGSNPNGVDGVYRDARTGIYQALSTIPVPTTNNVSNVISNIPLPNGAPAPPGITVSR